MLGALEWSPPEECRNRSSFTELLHPINKIHCGAVPFEEKTVRPNCPCS